MALSRRTGHRFQASIWPGFVDAMTGLLLVLMFVLTIFMVIQFVLRETITGQESELNSLSAELIAISQALGLEKNKVKSLEGELGLLSSTLSTVQAELSEQSALISVLSSERDAKALALSQAEEQITAFEAQVAGLLAAQSQADAKISDLEKQRDVLVDQQTALNIALAQARDEINLALETARRKAAEREALEALVESLKQQSLESTDEIESLKVALNEKEISRMVEAAAAAELRKRLKEADIELTAMTLALEEQRKKAEDTLTLLAASDGIRATLEAQLQKTLLQLEAITLQLDDKAQQLTALDDAKSTQDIQLKDLQIALAASIARQENLEQELANIENQFERKSQEVIGSESTLGELQQQLTTALLNLDREKQNRLDQEQVAQEKIADINKAHLEQMETLEQQLAHALAAQLSAQQDQKTTAEQLQKALAAKIAADELTKSQLSSIQERDILLSQANKELLEKNNNLSKTSQQLLDSQRASALLNQQMAELRKQLVGLQNLLEQSEDKDRNAQIQLQNLGNRLNAAIARAATEERKRRKLEERERQRLEAEREKLANDAKTLEKYRSEFFGRLREILGNQEGLRIVGDRFVFSSEVLFPPARADLSESGKVEIEKVATILNAVMNDIPEGIDWIIRVDGHTDAVPLSGRGEFADNWELSQARALSVVRYMISDLDIPADRLAANGFGQYQPVNDALTPEAFAQNRRIEIKLTEK